MKNFLFALFALMPALTFAQEPCIDPYYSEARLTNYISTKKKDLITLEVSVSSPIAYQIEEDLIFILDSYMEGVDVFVLEDMVQFIQMGSNLQVSPKDKDLKLVGVVKGKHKIIITYKKD